jgi:membrane fusion protein, multidrug efflux system
LRHALEEPRVQADGTGETRRAPEGARAEREDRDDHPGPAGERGRPRAPPAERRDAPAQSKLAAALSTARRHPLIVAGIAIALILCLAGALAWWLNARHYESTDDAFIDARTVTISSQVNGAIVELPVTDNQSVEENAVLLRIDDRDYRAAVDQAMAQIDQATANIANLDAQIAAQQARNEQAEKEVTQAQAALTFSEQENDRAQALLARGAGTQQQAQQTASDLRQKQAALDGAQANLVAGQKQIDVLQTQREAAGGQLEQARAAKEQADANLSRTLVKAPLAGRVTKLTTAKGAYAQVGQALMMLVPLELWVTANYKETQLADMRPGQPVDIRIDAYPGRSFAGHVDSIQSGSGAAFSLLPPENATGNYVKVVQRVPVKIVFDERPAVYLGPGVSVVPYVRVR